jgi:hypothetical protein
MELVRQAFNSMNNESLKKIIASRVGYIVEMVHQLALAGELPEDLSLGIVTSMLEYIPTAPEQPNTTPFNVSPSSSSSSSVSKYS